MIAGIDSFLDHQRNRYHGVKKARSVMMYLHGLSKDELLLKKRFEPYEESSKHNQIRMVTLFGQQVCSTENESFGFGNELMKDIDLRVPANHESVESQEFHSIGCSQDTVDLRFPLRIEASSTKWFDKRIDKVINSDGSGLLDLNKTPVSNDHQCFSQDLNFPYTEETELSNEKSGLNGFNPMCLDDVREKDSAASPASCFTAEKNSQSTVREDSCEVIQRAAECLVHISTVSFNQSQDFALKHISKSCSSSQDQEFIYKPETGKEKPSRSYDSFELQTLGIQETILEDVCCVSSKTIDDFNNKKEFGVKLRRGRRMKNFQKEILPELVSLSRHEIREDINILEAVLRSREYKKMHGKTKDGKCRPKPRNNKGLNQRIVGSRRGRTK